MNKRFWRVLGGLLVSAVSITAIAGLVVLDRIPEEVLIEKVTIAQGPLNGNRAQALLDVRQEASRFLDTERTYYLGDAQFSGSPTQTGFSVDWPAFETELHNALRPQLFQKLKLLTVGQQIEMPLVWDSTIWDAYKTTHPVELPMQNPRIALNGAALEVQAGHAGTELDPLSLQAQTNLFWQDFQVTEPIAVDMLAIEPEFSDAELAALLPQVETLKDKKITLQKPDLSASVDWAWNDHFDLLIPEDGTLKLNPTAFPTAAQGVAVDWEKPAESVTITETEAGYQFEGSARRGETVDWTALRQALEASIATPVENLVVAITTSEPEINVPQSLKDQGVTDLLSVGISSFYGSPSNRIHNIHVGVEKFSGLTIQPGEEFSFTKNMGHVDASGGWLPELVIKGDETVPEYGGGLCQVSSTMYRAALYSGLPITMRRNHSYAVSYYAQVTGYGLDATIYDPWPDLRFTNDTAAPILIQSYVEDRTAYFVFYGKNDGRTVTMEGPKSYGHHSIAEPVIVYTDKLAPGVRELKEHPHVGFKTDWYRTIHYADGRVLDRENIHSDYEARPAKYFEGIATEAPPSL